MTNHSAEFEVFWGEISPSEHFVQIYEEEVTFLDTLEGFIGGGLQADDAAIVIATPDHLESLGRRLRARGVDVDLASAENRYVALDAEHTLSQFMRNGWPDERLFIECIRGILERARGDEGRRVRAFGEMVALLWAQGHSGATVRLEHLWHEFCRTEMFTLFCAYPRSGFTQDASTSLQEICAAHSQVISN